MAALALFVVLFIVDLVVAIATSAHWVSDVPPMLAWEGPLLVLGLLLRSTRRSAQRLCAVIAFVSAVWATALLVGSWNELPSAWGVHVVATQPLYIAICVLALVVELPAFRRHSR
jgi:hypothetical protein